MKRSHAPIFWLLFGGGGMLAALLGCAIASALAWGKLARLFALKALAEDAHNRR